MEKEVKIIPPENWEIDLNKSNLKENKIIYKEKKVIKELPKTWEEAYDSCAGYTNYLSEYLKNGIVTYKSILISKERCEEVLAFIQLLFLRDIYRDGWIPDLKNDNKIWYIYNFKDSISKDFGYCHAHVLSFKSHELRDLFLENFRDLIEKAKYLI